MQLQVDFYSPTGQQDQERKVICFIDMSTLNVEDKNSKMAHKEISKCLHHSIYPFPEDNRKDSPHSAVSKITSEMVHDAAEVTSAEMRGPGEECRKGGQKTFLYSKLSNKNKCGKKQVCQRDSKEFAESISEGLMVYANQVASDMMVSVMKDLESA